VMEVGHSCPTNNNVNDRQEECPSYLVRGVNELTSSFFLVRAKENPLVISTRGFVEPQIWVHMQMSHAFDQRPNNRQNRQAPDWRDFGLSRFLVATKSEPIYRFLHFFNHFWGNVIAFQHQRRSV